MGADFTSVGKLFKSEAYTVEWGTPLKIDADATLEIGSGSGHGFTIRWSRFLPMNDGVDVISIDFDEGRHPYETKWPADRAPVKVKKARMNSDEYRSLLQLLGKVASAKLTRADQKSITTTTANFWAFCRLGSKSKVLIDYDWAGYMGSNNEIKYAKPWAAVQLTRESISKLEFKEYTLSATDRSWASAKFIREWKDFQKRDYYWWVRERFIVTIGVVGDKSVFPTLREIIGGDPKDRNVYYAINAATRILGKDVRDKPYEDMDIEKTRKKLLPLLRGAK